jgi:hypothetical protein
MDSQEFFWATNAGPAFSWQLNDLVLMRTQRGLLLIPSSAFFLFVPRGADFEGLAFRDFVRSLRTRQQQLAGNALLGA